MPELKPSHPSANKLLPAKSLRVDTNPYPPQHCQDFPYIPRLRHRTRPTSPFYPFHKTCNAPAHYLFTSITPLAHPSITQRASFRNFSFACFCLWRKRRRYRIKPIVHAPSYRRPLDHTPGLLPMADDRAAYSAPMEHSAHRPHVSQRQTTCI